MKSKRKPIFSAAAVFIIAAAFVWGMAYISGTKPGTLLPEPVQAHWFMLHRKSNMEYLYFGLPGESGKSRLLKAFPVKPGVPGEKPTPLPSLAGRDYWVIVSKMEALDNPDTAPYFLTLDVPAPDVEPYGPAPYFECDGQCNWQMEGPFGLHGINGDEGRLSADDPGSSGCVRHTDGDITYLYNLLDPRKEQIRYYIQDI